LIPTIVEKDYVLGWLLAGIPHHPELTGWAFKGGTCLKKCFFETYRFSEDLDYTVQEEVRLSPDAIAAWLGELATWVESEAGIQFPRDRLNVEEYTNPRGRPSFQARLTYVGPLNLPRQSRQRVKLDITQDEWIGDDTELREVFHPYGDLPPPPPRVRCYSVNEILAEKTRALYERQGRARDVYDVVHINREFRDSITPAKAVDLLEGKFRFKKLPEPSVKDIMARIELDVVRRDWAQQLRHQLPVLPPVEGFLEELQDAIAWWLEPAQAARPLEAISISEGERTAPRQRFPSLVPTGAGFAEARLAPGLGSGAMERIRFAARNRLCVELRYHGVGRVVEPYSLRYPRTGSTLLYVFEVLRGGSPSGRVKALNVAEIERADVAERPFRPRFGVEL
jgi:predicted nucleotidyltransferase component of viral defense system